MTVQKVKALKYKTYLDPRLPYIFKGVDNRLLKDIGHFLIDAVRALSSVKSSKLTIFKLE